MFNMIKHKYKAKACEADGKKFPSKLERSYYNQLKLRQQNGEILFFLRQTPFDIPGGKYLADFTLFLASGDVEFVDVKGMDTPMSKLKRKAVEELYPVTIKIVTK
jgi:hypothetical protein